MWRAGPVRRVPEFGRPQALRLGFALAPGMRVGLYGGSFNPVHEGHVQVAATARMRLGLDRLIWLVSPGNPLKSGQAGADLPSRLAAVRKVAAGPATVISGLEAQTGSAFSIDTLRVLMARFPGVQFIWIIGADNLADFHRWRGWREIARQVPIAVVARPGSTLSGLLSPAARRLARFRKPASQARGLADMAPPAWVFLPMPLNFLSSSAIRADRAKTDSD